MGGETKEANRNDLRWRRTERHLKEALAHQLKNLPLDKVKVTEICREAEISKATFYLHYQDIYDLADAFVEAHAEALLDQLGDPSLPFYDVPAFVRSFIQVFRSQEHKDFMKIADRNRMMPLFMDQLLQKLEERAEAQAPAPKGIKPQIGLAFIISGLGGAVQSNETVSSEELEKHLTEFISKAFEVAAASGSNDVTSRQHK